MHQASVTAQHHAMQAEHQSAVAHLTAQQATATSVTALQETSMLKHEAANVIFDIQSRMQELHDRQGQAHSIATSSKHRSATALKMVEELRQAREQDQQNFQSRMGAMKKVMQQQVQVSTSAINAIQALKTELEASRSESHRLQQALNASQEQLAQLTLQ